MYQKGLNMFLLTFMTMVWSAGQSAAPIPVSTLTADQLGRMSRDELKNELARLEALPKTSQTLTQTDLDCAIIRAAVTNLDRPQPATGSVEPPAGEWGRHDSNFDRVPTEEGAVT